MSEIPFWISGTQKWVSGINSQTTCHNVLSALIQSSSQRKSLSQEHDDEELKKFVIVEKWKGVEKPLNASMKILNIWKDWGEDTGQVKFIVKRISQQQQQDGEKIPGKRHMHHRRRHFPRKSRSKLIEENYQHHPVSLHNVELQKLLNIISAQAEIISAQLHRLKDREVQIDDIEYHVHETRSKTVGKDYLTKSYLAKDTERPGTEKPEDDLCLVGSEKIGDDILSMVTDLEKLDEINETLIKNERIIFELNKQISISHEQLISAINRDDVESMRRELKQWSDQNIDNEYEIHENSKRLKNLNFDLSQKGQVMKQLEEELLHTESENAKLRSELEQTLNRSDQNIIDINVKSDFPKMTQDDKQSSKSDSIEEEEESSAQKQKSKSSPSMSSLKTLSGSSASVKSFLEGHFKFSSRNYNDRVVNDCKTRIYETLEQLRIKIDNNSDEKDSAHSTSSSASGSPRNTAGSPEDIVGSLGSRGAVSAIEEVNIGAESQNVDSKRFSNILMAEVDVHSDTSGLSSWNSSSDEGSYQLDTLV